MARGSRTVYDVPAEIRSKSVNEARKHIQQMLLTPNLPPQQREGYLEQLQWYSRVESLDLADVVPPPVEFAPTEPAPAMQATNHSVELSEDLSIQEG